LRAKIDIVISIDTSKAQVARAAIAAGASIVNDVTGGRSDKEMMPLIAETKAGFIIIHMQGNPRTMQSRPAICRCGFGKWLIFFDNNIHAP